LDKVDRSSGQQVVVAAADDTKQQSATLHPGTLLWSSLWCSCCSLTSAIVLPWSWSS